MKLLSDIVHRDRLPLAYTCCELEIEFPRNFKKFADGNELKGRAFKQKENVTQDFSNEIQILTFA